MVNIKWKKHNGLYFAIIIFILSSHFITKGSIAYTLYYDYFYVTIRDGSSLLISWLPFASIYIILPMVVIIMVNYWRRSVGYTYNLIERLRKIANILGVWYGMFYVLWGFNYAGLPVKDRLGFHEIKADSLEMYNELLAVSLELNKMRHIISNDTVALYPNINSSHLEKAVSVVYNRELPKLGYKPFSNSRVRPLKPKGSLLSISTAGVYIPYTLEGHFDPGLHPLQWPFTIAHEMAHVYGVTDEGECNFLAYLACRRTNDPIIQYSATIGYWRYLFAEANYSNEEKSKKIYKTLDKSVQNDLKSISKNLDSYPDYFPVLRNAIYDYYLKANGVMTGLESYNEMIELIIEAKKHTSLVAF